MKILIYGGGSLGLLFARYLSKECSIEVVSKHERKSAIEKNGLVFIKNSEKENLKLKIFDSMEDIQQSPDFIILSVKSFDIDNALEEISAVLKNRYIVTIQNGVYAESAAGQIAGDEYVLPAYVMIGSKTINNNTIEEFLNKGMKIGYLNKKSESEAKRINEILNKSGIDSTVSDNIMKQKWHKMMFYCAGAILNSLTGTKDLEDANIRWIVKKILNEIESVAKNLKLNFDISSLVLDVYDFLMNFKPEKWNASVGEDLKKGKKTEIDYLNGYIVKLAEEFKVDVPFNRMLLSLIKTLEKTKYFTQL